MAGRFQRVREKRVVPGWPWLCRCPVCGTSIMLDDEFVRSEGSRVHAECERYRRSRQRAAPIKSAVRA